MVCDVAHVVTTMVITSLREKIERLWGLVINLCGECVRLRQLECGYGT